MYRAFAAVAALILGIGGAAATAAPLVFFDSTQIATEVAAGDTWDKVRSNGYLFTYTRDKLYTGGIGSEPIGRPVRVPWPEGVEAQAVTAGPNPGKAKITIERADGDVFDVIAFTAQLLANTAATGASIEVVPFLNGEEVFDDPFYFNASGYAGSTFSYDRSPSYLGTTAPLTGFDRYTFGLFVDYALTALTLEGPATPGTTGDYNGNGLVEQMDLDLVLVCWGEATSTVPSGWVNDLPSGSFIDQAELDRVLSNWGRSIAGAASFPAVPEPAASTVLLGALAAWLCIALHRNGPATRRTSDLVNGYDGKHNS